MKTIKTFLIFVTVCLFAKLSLAQLYMNSVGSISVGSVLPTYSGVALQSFGNTLFSSATGSSNSAAYILASNGFSSATSPDYTWWDDNQTGIYHPAVSYIGFTVNGGEVMKVVGNSYGSDQVVANLYSSGNTAWDIWNGSGFSFYIYQTGAVWAYSYNTLSDARLKENIKTIEDPLNKVLKLHGVTFTYIANKKDSGSTQENPKTQMGLIAQEVQQVVPEVVNTGKDGYLGVQYQNLVGLLVEAIKQEDKKVTALQNRLDSCCNLSQQYGSNSPNNNGATGNQSSTNSSIQAVLYQNIPNPFTKATTIQCYLPTTGVTSASILIFDMTGALKGTYPINGGGTQNTQINGSTLSAGMYYYSLVVNGQIIDTKKMILTN